MHSGTTDFLKIISVLLFIVAAVWWLESRFDSTVAVIVVGGLFGVVCLIAGMLLTHATARATMSNMIHFNKANVDLEKQRQQAFKAMLTGDSALKKASSQLQVLDAKRINKLAEGRAKLLTDVDRKWQGEQDDQQDAWAWNRDAEAFPGWE